MQVTGTVNWVGELTVMAKVLLIPGEAGEKFPPLTPLMVMLVPVTKLCGEGVVTMHGLVGRIEDMATQALVQFKGIVNWVGET